MRYESLVGGPHAPPQGPYPKVPFPRSTSTSVRPSPLPTRTSGHPEANAKPTGVLLTQVATKRDALLEGCLAAGPHHLSWPGQDESLFEGRHILTWETCSIIAQLYDVPGYQEVQCERDRVSIALHNQPNHACPGRAQTSNLGLLHRARSRLFENLAPSLSIHIPDVHEHYPKPILALTIKTLPPKRVPRRVLYQPAGHLPNTTCRV